MSQGVLSIIKLLQLTSFEDRVFSDGWLRDRNSDGAKNSTASMLGKATETVCIYCEDLYYFMFGFGDVYENLKRALQKDVKFVVINKQPLNKSIQKKLKKDGLFDKILFINGESCVAELCNGYKLLDDTTLTISQCIPKDIMIVDDKFVRLEYDTKEHLARSYYGSKGVEPPQIRQIIESFKSVCWDLFDFKSIVVMPEWYRKKIEEEGRLEEEKNRKISENAVLTHN